MTYQKSRDGNLDLRP